MTISFPSYNTLTIPILQAYLQTISPTFRFFYNFRHNEFKKLVERLIFDDRSRELIILLDFVDPLLHADDPELITPVLIGYALASCKLDAVLFLADRYSIDSLKLDCYYSRHKRSLLGYSYWMLTRKSVRRSFFLQLMKRGTGLFNQPTYNSLLDEIRHFQHTHSKGYIEDLNSVRVLLTLVSVYSVDRLGPKSHLVKGKGVPLDIIRKLTGFLRVK